MKTENEVHIMNNKHCNVLSLKQVREIDFFLSEKRLGHRTGAVVKPCLLLVKVE